MRISGERCLTAGSLGNVTAGLRSHPLLRKRVPCPEEEFLGSLLKRAAAVMCQWDVLAEIILAAVKAKQVTSLSETAFVIEDATNEIESSTILIDTTNF